MERQVRDGEWRRDRVRFWNRGWMIAVPALGAVLAAGLFVLCYFQLFESLTPCNEDTAPAECEALVDSAAQEKTSPSTDVEAYVARRAAKSEWSVSVFLILLAFAAALILSVYVIRSSLPPALRRRGGQFFTALGLTVTVGSFLYFLVLKETPEEAGDPISTFRAAVLDGTDEMWLQAVNILGVVALVFLSAAAAACVRACDVTRRDEEGLDVAGWRLRRQSRWLDGVFYAGAGALIAGSVEVSSLYRLIATASPDAQSIASAASAYATSLGLGLSVMLAVLYLPAAFILQRRAQAFADWALDTPKERQSWLESYGLRATWWDRAVRVATVAGPFLVSGGEGLLAILRP